jgi:hypothetical protein
MFKVSMLRGLLKKIVEKAGYEIKRIPRAETELILTYEKGGRIPWSPGYDEVKQRLIEEMLTFSRLREFSQNKLPEHLGKGIDERCVEYPWLLSRICSGPERILDAGSALNHAFVLSNPLLRNKKIDILTLAPETNCFWQNGVSYLYCDLRSIPIVDSYYDTIACISTIEHIGLNNTQFARQAKYSEDAPEDYLVALCEMQRVLKPGGVILITIPYGRYHNFGTFQQFDAQHVDRLIQSFGPSQVEETYFCYTSDGWKTSSREDCRDLEYVDWIMRPSEQRRAFPDHADRAAAARSVACLSMVKPRTSSLKSNLSMGGK